MKNVTLQGAANLRDFGGTKTVDRKTVKSGLFFRGSALDKLTNADMEKIKNEWGVRLIIDLRTPCELEERPDKTIDGIKYLHFSLLDESLYGISHEKAFDDPDIVRKVPDMCDLYRDISHNKYALSNLKNTFQAILNAPEGAVYWHCKEGKDRCGIVSALFLTLLGVDRQTVTQDYLTTNKVALGKARKAFIGSLIKFKNLSFAKKIYGIFLAKEDYLNASFDAFLQTYGSMDAFFRDGLGITEEQIQKLKQKCLE